MSAIFSLCDGDNSCLVSLADIASILPDNRKFSHQKIESTLLALSEDGYFDLITSRRKGEIMYVINLKKNKSEYRRAAIIRRRDVLYKIMLAFVGALATFIFGLIIKAICGS
jgi:hypothetical protein